MTILMFATGLRQGTGRLPVEYSGRAYQPARKPLPHPLKTASLPTRLARFQKKVYKSGSDRAIKRYGFGVLNQGR